MATASISIQLANNSSASISGEIDEAEATNIASQLAQLIESNTTPAAPPAA